MEDIVAKQQKVVITLVSKAGDPSVNIRTGFQPAFETKAEAMEVPPAIVAAINMLNSLKGSGEVDIEGE